MNNFLRIEKLKMPIINEYYQTAPLEDEFAWQSSSQTAASIKSARP